MTVIIHWRGSGEHGILRSASQFFLLIGGLALGFCALVYFNAELYQSYGNRRFDNLPSLERVTTSTLRPKLRVFAQEGSPLSRMAIPRLAVSVVVSEGIKPYTLARAAGHIPGTAFPDESGNVGIAGHRDTFFRKLGEIRRDDRIILTTPVGSYQYSVEWTRVVTPSHVEVLQPSNAATLTLVTCYPFTYVGPAPKRFIVRARRVD
jgi:sortase A